MAIPSQRAFMEAVLTKTGMSKTDLGAAVQRNNSYNAVYDWQTERLDLHYPEMMQMLDLCGWLTADALECLREAEQAASRAADEAGRLLPPPPNDSEQGA